MDFMQPLTAKYLFLSINKYCNASPSHCGGLQKQNDKNWFIQTAVDQTMHVHSSKMYV